MGIAEVIPLVQSIFLLEEISQGLDEPCVFIDEYHANQRLDEVCDFSITNSLSIKVINSNITYYVETTKHNTMYMSALDYLEDNNKFDLDVHNFEKLWRDMDLKIFNVSSDSTCEYYEDINFFKLIEFLAKKYKGIISINESIYKIPGYLYSLDEWQKLTGSLK